MTNYHDRTSIKGVSHLTYAQLLPITKNENELQQLLLEYDWVTVLGVPMISVKSVIKFIQDRDAGFGMEQNSEVALDNVLNG